MNNTSNPVLNTILGIGQGDNNPPTIHSSGAVPYGVPMPHWIPQPSKIVPGSTVLPHGVPMPIVVPPPMPNMRCNRRQAPRRWRWVQVGGRCQLVKR